MKVMAQVHEGVCGAHQAGIKMRWLLRRHGYFWPSITRDCIKYAKGCRQCQQHGSIQRVPAFELHPIIKPWPFRGWAIDLIGKIYPASSKGHHFMVVATDYFTKWVEAVPAKKVEQADMIDFIKDQIIHRFGIPETITTDQGTMFTGDDFRTFAEDYGIKLIHSTPHYPQANGQAEASNKVIIGILERMIGDNPRAWHKVLSETLWAYRTSKRSSTGCSPFALTFGHDAVLPMEVVIPSLRVSKQNDLTPEDYTTAMILELEQLEDDRIQALNNIQIQKKKVARAYNKRVKRKVFQEGQLVWKVILPVGSKDRTYGKWSPNWEGPFKIHKVLKGNSYWLADLDNQPHRRFINGQYLKAYIPTMWESISR